MTQVLGEEREIRNVLASFNAYIAQSDLPGSKSQSFFVNKSRPPVSRRRLNCQVRSSKGPRLTISPASRCNALQYCPRWTKAFIGEQCAWEQMNGQFELAYVVLFCRFFKGTGWMLWKTQQYLQFTVLTIFLYCCLNSKRTQKIRVITHELRTAHIWRHVLSTSLSSSWQKRHGSLRFIAIAITLNTLVTTSVLQRDWQILSSEMASCLRCSIQTFDLIIWANGCKGTEKHVWCTLSWIKSTCERYTFVSCRHLTTSFYMRWPEIWYPSAINRNYRTIFFISSRSVPVNSALLLIFKMQKLTSKCLRQDKVKIWIGDALLITM